MILLHLMDRLMERQLDTRAAGMLHQALAGRDIEVVLEAEIGMAARCGMLLDEAGGKRRVRVDHDAGTYSNSNGLSLI